MNPKLGLSNPNFLHCQTVDTRPLDAPEHATTLPLDAPPTPDSSCAAVPAVRGHVRHSLPLLLSSLPPSLSLVGGGAYPCCPRLCLDAHSFQVGRKPRPRSRGLPRAASREPRVVRERLRCAHPYGAAVEAAAGPRNAAATPRRRLWSRPALETAETSGRRLLHSTRLASEAAHADSAMRIASEVG